jgi:aspartate/methionine/tyrosine aminotransferase
MRPQPFALERYFAQYEFSVRHLLCSSDAESMTVAELLALEPGAEKQLRSLRLGYTEPPGDSELRALIAARYERIGSENVLVHAGAQEAIFAFMNAVLQPGDHIVVQFPAYQSHYAIAKAAGAQVSYWHSDLSHGGAPDPDELRALIQPATRAVVITTPNNPTGYVFDRPRLNAVVDIARRHGVWLFSDEVYHGSERNPADRLPFACDLYERAVSLGGTAKVHGLAGLRIGWVATQSTCLTTNLAAFKDYLSICNSAPSEFFSKIALRHQDHLFERTRRITARNLDLLDAFFARHDDFSWQRPRAGTTAFPCYRKGSARRFCADLVERAGVLLLPSTVYDAGDEHFRIGYGRLNMPQALERFEAYLNERGKADVAFKEARV